MSCWVQIKDSMFRISDQGLRPSRPFFKCNGRPMFYNQEQFKGLIINRHAWCNQDLSTAKPWRICYEAHHISCVQPQIFDPGPCSSKAHVQGPYTCLSTASLYLDSRIGKITYVMLMSKAHEIRMTSIPIQIQYKRLLNAPKFYFGPYEAGMRFNLIQNVLETVEILSGPKNGILSGRSDRNLSKFCGGILWWNLHIKMTLFLTLNLV